MDYLGGVKSTTVEVYKNNLQRHIKPVLGAVALSELRPYTVQEFISGMELPSSSARSAYRVLHQVLGKVVKLEYVSRNPVAGCKLPRPEQKGIYPLEDQQMAALLRAVKGSRPELLVSIALFIGLRQSELLGLMWDYVDLQKGMLLASKQLSRILHREGGGLSLSPKSGKSRAITPASPVLKTLREQQRRQTEVQLKAGSLQSDAHNLVFTNETGGPLEQWRIEKGYQVTAGVVGLAGAYPHDLRHTYIVNTIRTGDDIRAMQGNLGHTSAVFALGRYGHFTERMRQDSTAHMEGFIKSVLGS